MGIETLGRHLEPSGGLLSALQTSCAYGATKLHRTVTLEVFEAGVLVARSATLEHGEVADTLHALARLFPLADGYRVIAAVKDSEA